MLDPAWPLTRPLLWLLLAAMLALLVWRALRRDRREYARFKRYRSTKRRQAMLWKWLRESFLLFGGLAVLGLVLSWQQIRPLLDELAAWPGVSHARAWLAENPGFGIGAGAGTVIALTVLTVLGMREARKEGDLVAVGDIRALLPRNRQELRIGALLSLNAGLVEELPFRLAVPAMLLAASGSAVLAVAVSVLVFGGLHAYQGLSGVIGTTIVGALMMAVLALTGSILWPIVLHAAFNLRSLVLLPMAVFGAHRIDGRTQPVISAAPKLVSPEPAADPNRHRIDR